MTSRSPEGLECIGEKAEGGGWRKLKEGKKGPSICTATRKSLAREVNIYKTDSMQRLAVGFPSTQQPQLSDGLAFRKMYNPLCSCSLGKFCLEQAKPPKILPMDNVNNVNDNLKKR